MTFLFFAVLQLLVLAVYQIFVADPVLDKVTTRWKNLLEESGRRWASKVVKLHHKALRRQAYIRRLRGELAEAEGVIAALALEIDATQKKVSEN